MAVGYIWECSALKGAHSIQLCDTNRTPLLFLQNITGFMVGREYERRGITKDGLKLTMAVSGAAVPKLTVNCNGSYGAGTYGMSRRAFDPRFMFTWPQVQISVMFEEQAAGVLTEIKAKKFAREQLVNRVNQFLGRACAVGAGAREGPEGLGQTAWAEKCRPRIRKRTRSTSPALVG
ncbi:carboxyl transferase domain-containing protein [Bradyrhizobium sp. JR3.5]